MSGSAFAVTHHAFSSGAGRTSDGNGSHASTLKSPSYTKSVSWQHYPDGAQNIYLALSTNDNNTLDKSNKIVPADPQQNQVRLQESAVSGGLFTYYVGYVSPTPKSATSGPITSWATWELVYN